MEAARKIIVPLDVSTTRQALSIVNLLRGRVGMFKIGLQLFSAAGPDAVRQIVATGERVFLDLKFHDIPRTVGRAVREAADLGVAMLNVHVSGGARMVSAAAEALAERGGQRPLLLGVTVLTSLTQAELESTGVRGSVVDHVVALASMGQAAGLDGVVASPHEIGPIKRACGERFVVVTPGVRPAGAPADDQRRVMTPADAVAAGADYLVIGRPILEAADPAASVQAIAGEMSS